jgi:vesicle-fusing ATPase
MWLLKGKPAVPNANTSRAALLIEEGKPPAAKTSVLVNSSLEKKSPEPPKTEKESLPQPIIQPNSFKIAKLTDNLIAYQNRVIVSEKYKHLGSLAQINYVINNKTKTVYVPVNFKDIDDETAQMSAGMREQFCCALEQTMEVTIVEAENTAPITDIAIKLVKLSGEDRHHKIEEELLAKQIKIHFANYPLCPGQRLLFKLKNESNLLLEIEITHINGLSEVGEPRLFQIQEDSEIAFSLAEHCAKKCTLKSVVVPKKITLDFTARGVGGHKEELEKLLRSIFYTRAMGEKYIKAYDAKHTKGVLLYGPPGTGKTLIARTIAHCFSKDKVKIVNGPELKNQFVGKSEENLRNVFAEANDEWMERGEQSDLYVIIFDEIDALCPPRGSRSGGTGVDDDMVTQLLTILDGVDSPQNIVVIGMTNRKELIDPAVLRPGRLGVHIEIGLPDKKGRLEILKIKTEKMQDGVLHSSVDLEYWAEQTANFTGAELEELVNGAKQFAMHGNFDNSKATELSIRGDIKEIAHLSKVTNEHFKLSFAQVIPAFGFDKKMRTFKRELFAEYPAIQHITRTFDAAILTTAIGERAQFLIHGPSGVGKTHLALALALRSEAKYIRTITAENLLGLPLDKQLKFIDEVFVEAERAKSSVIILDDLESLVGADAELQGYNNTLRLKFQSKLKDKQSSGSCTLIATTSNDKFIQKLGLKSLFLECEHLGSVHLKSLSSEASYQTLQQICASIGFEIKPGSYDLSQNDLREIKIPIRDLIYQIKKYCTNAKLIELDIDGFYRTLPSSYKPEPFKLSNSKQSFLRTNFDESTYSDNEEQELANRM